MTSDLMKTLADGLSVSADLENVAVDEIKAALNMPVTAAEPTAPATTTKKEPLKPIDLTQKIKEKKPTKIDYEDVRVVPLESAELAVSSLRAFRERYKKMMDLKTKYNSIQTIADTQKRELGEKMGETQLIQELNEYKEKFGQAVEELNAEMPTLIESGDVLMGIVESIKEGTITGEQKYAILKELVDKEVPEKAKALNEKAESAFNQLKIAGDKIVREFEMWHPSKTFRQEVKEYQTKASIKQADILDSLKAAGEKLLGMLKSGWEKVSDAVSSFLVDSEDTKDAIDSVIAVAREQGVEV